MADEPISSDSNSTPINPTASGSTNPLPYEAPRDQLARNPQPNVLLNTIGFLTGFAIATVIVFFGTMVVAAGLSTSSGGGHRAPQYATATLYFILAITAIILAITWKQPGVRTTGTWFRGGLLMGAGLSMLVGGLCFSSMM